MNTITTRVLKKFRTVFVLVAVIWIVFVLDRFLPLEQFALVPRTLSGIPGIFLSPFLHLDLSHVTSNTIPLVALLALLVGSRGNGRHVIFIIIIVSGLLLWLFGRPVAVVGASGLVFGLIGFLVASGLFERRLVAIVVALFVGVTYGTTLLFGVLPGQPGISWDGHLYGAVGGVFAAWWLSRK